MKDDLEELSVLIVGYRRADNILKILEICRDSGISNIYLSVDGPKPENAKGVSDHFEIQRNIAKFKLNFSGNLIIHLRERNVGCAATVMSSCDWFFKHTDYGVVLEDDCIPTKDFFLFAKSMKQKICSDKRIWLACGTQFAPKELIDNSAIISRYALTWGWVTSQQKWLEIRRSIFQNSQEEARGNSRLGIVDKVYWEAGARRAYQGFTDVWDSILVYRMQVENKFSILPPENLITNIGNDFAATHTKDQSIFLNRERGIYTDSEISIQENYDLDIWISKNVYGISKRHLCTTKITKIVDILFRRAKFTELLLRWEQSQIH